MSQSILSKNKEQKGTAKSNYWAKMWVKKERK